MVKHIVVYTLKEGVDKDAAVALVASKLEPLVGQIPGLLKMEIRRCYAGMDYALYSEFESREALTDYASHPLHIEAKGENNHHLIEGVFKAFARALKMAVRRDVFSYELPSSKGVL